MVNPRDVELNIVGHDKSEKATRSAADNLDKLSRKAKDVDDANKKLGSRADGHLRRLSDALRGAATQLDRYKRKAGDADDANLSLGRRAAGHLRRMSRSVDDATDHVERLERAVNDVDKANQTMAERSSRAFRRVGKVMAQTAHHLRSIWEVSIIPAIIVALGLLPVAATAVGTAIVLGIAGGLAALGIVVASKNEAVKKSFTDLKDHVVKTLGKIAAPFEAVLINIADKTKEAFDGFVPDLDEAFRRVAAITENFAEDVIASLDELKPAIDPIVDAFVVLTETLGEELPGLMESVATALIDIANAIKENPQSIRDMVDGLGELIVAIGKIIAWLIRAGSQIEAFEASIDVAMLGVQAAFVETAAKASWMTVHILESLALLPGPFRTVFQTLASAARVHANATQGSLDKINTRRAQADVRFAEARLRVLGAMKPSPKVNAEIAELKRKIAEAKRLLGLLDGTTATTYVKTVRTTVARFISNSPGDRGNNRIYAGGVGFALTAPGGTYRTGGPAMPDVYATTYVTLDGREIAAAVKTVINEATGRQAFRARSGRR